MTDLTEQWKKGELPSGWYYYKSSILGNITISDSSTLHKYRNRLDWKDIITILAKVPTYEEWKALLSDQLAKNEGVEINAELNERLKKTQEFDWEIRKENNKLRKKIDKLHADVDYLKKRVDNLLGDDE